MKTEHGADTRLVRFSCFLCGAMCGMKATVDGDRIVSAVADRDNPISGGYSCPKGRAFPQMHHSPDRLDRPRLNGVAVSWDVLLDDLAQKLRVILDDGGPDSVARYIGTGFSFLSEGFAAHKFFDALGSRQLYSAMTLDTAPAMRAAELVTGFSRSTPVWTPDDPKATLAVFIGQNPANSGGYMGTPSSNFTQRIRTFRAQGGEVWTIDPRVTKTSRQSDRHLAPRAGSDVFILAWLVRELLSDGFDAEELRTACDPADVERLREVVKPVDLELVTRRTGLEKADLCDLLAAIRRHRTVSIMAGTGVCFSPSGTLAYWLVWAVRIITGSLDREGGMRFLSANLGAMNGPPWEGHAPEDGAYGPGPESRPDLANVFGEHPSVAIADEIESGKIKAMMILGGNPIAASPDPDRLRAALATLDVLVVIDVVEWEMTEIATHVVPCAWHSERNDMRCFPEYGADRAYATPAIVPLSGERRHGWWVLAQLGHRLGFDIFEGIEGIDPHTRSDESLVRTLSRLTCDFADEVFATGSEGFEIPHRYGWYHEKVLPNGRWRLAPRVMVDRLAVLLHDEADMEPVLVSGRTLQSVNSSHYAVVEGKGPPPIHVSADTAHARSIVAGDRIRICTKSGYLEGTAFIDQSMAPGSVWIAHGWHGQNVNRLTDPAADHLTGQPFFTGIPVKIERVDPPVGSEREREGV